MEYFKWPLKESDINSEVCGKCGICCSMELKPSWHDERMMKALEVMVQGHENIMFLGNGIRITCSHLKKSSDFGNASYRCNIYDSRPQLCRDFNCVTWAKVSNNLDQYNRVLDKLGIKYGNMEKV